MNDSSEKKKNKSEEIPLKVQDKCPCDPCVCNPCKYKTLKK